MNADIKTVNRIMAIARNRHGRGVTLQITDVGKPKATVLKPNDFTITLKTATGHPIGGEVGDSPNDCIDRLYNKLSGRGRDKDPE